jgi:hypothetical protein
MDVLGPLAVIGTLVSNAAAKIFLMLAGVVISFLAIPQTRAAAMFGVAIISAFAGGILIEGYHVHNNWSDMFSMSLAFGIGFLVYPLLSLFKRFNELVSNDQEAVELIYAALKRKIFKLLSIDKSKK